MKTSIVSKFRGQGLSEICTYSPMLCFLRHSEAFFLRKRLLTSVLNKKFSADVICGQSSILWQRGYPRHFRIKSLAWFCQFLAWLLSWPTVMSSREWIPLEGNMSIHFHFYDMFWGILSRGKFLPPVLDKKFSADVIQLWPELHIIAAS